MPNSRPRISYPRIGGLKACGRLGILTGFNHIRKREANGFCRYLSSVMRSHQTRAELDRRINHLDIRFWHFSDLTRCPN
jgi:hypothetical protein